MNTAFILERKEFMQDREEKTEQQLQENSSHGMTECFGNRKLSNHSLIYEMHIGSLFLSR